MSVRGKGDITIIPDAIFKGEKNQLVEVKNVKYLSNTDQFRAYVNQSDDLTLIVRYDTVISKPLLEELEAKNVKIYETSLNVMSGSSSSPLKRRYY